MAYAIIDIIHHAVDSSRSLTLLLLILNIHRVQPNPWMNSSLQKELAEALLCTALFKMRKNTVHKDVFCEFIVWPMVFIGCHFRRSILCFIDSPYHLNGRCWSWPAKRDTSYGHPIPTERTWLLGLNLLFIRKMIPIKPKLWLECLIQNP